MRDITINRQLHEIADFVSSAFERGSEIVDHLDDKDQAVLDEALADLEGAHDSIRRLARKDLNKAEEAV